MVAEQKKLSDLVTPTPKQRALFEATWRATMEGNPEYLLWGGAAGPGKVTHFVGELSSS